MSAVVGTRRAMKELADGTIRVQVDIDPPHRKAFLELFSDIDMPVVMARFNPAAQGTAEQGTGEPDAPIIARPTPEQENTRILIEIPPNTLAHKLHANGYFRSPRLWLALHMSGIYTVQDHKRFVEKLPCIELGKPVWPCSGDVCLHHARGAESDAAGPKLQPEAPMKVPHWYGVPLCHEHHIRWAHGSNGATREDHQEMKRQAVDLMAEAAKRKVKELLVIDSLKKVTAEDILRFEENAGIEGLAKRMGVL